MSGATKTEGFPPSITRAAEQPFGNREVDWWIGCSGFPRSADAATDAAFREVPEGGRTRSLIA